MTKRKKIENKETEKEKNLKRQEINNNGENNTEKLQEKDIR